MDNYLLHMASTLPRAWQPFMLFITFLGSSTVLIPLVLGVAALELYMQRTKRAGFMALSLLSLPLYVVIKMLVHRARPMSDMVQQLHLHDYSFPSGHATGSIAVYGTLACLLWTRLPRPWARFCAIALGVLILLIGFSRVYLGVHYPTDVLGGWILGSLLVYALYFYFNKKII